MKRKLRTSDDQLRYHRSFGESRFSSTRLLIALLLCLTPCWIAIGIPTTSGLAFWVSETPAKVSHPAVARLTFADRMAYQRAIEEIYWRHRIWPNENSNPKPSLDAVMTQAQLEEKVEDYLRKSQALEHDSRRPITAEHLQAEMDRMAQDTKQPEVLRELFEALENDPFVIAECLARPVLTERLLNNQYERIDRGPRQRTEINQKAHLPARSLANISGAAQSEPGLTTAVRQEESPEFSPVNAENQMPNTVTAPNSGYSLPAISDVAGGCTVNTWTATAISPAARDYHTAVWTGTEMIVWGGLNVTGSLNTGGRYNPSTDSWTATNIANAPSGRWGHTAVWTGSEMIIWGGADPIFLGTGARYNPVTNSWTATSTVNAPSGRTGHTAVWTGTEMIIWGGAAPNNDGGKYNPNTNSWTATSTTNAPTARTLHTAVWSGNEMIVWGGTDGSILTPDPVTGGRYNPSTDSWTATSTTNVPAARYSHTAVWTGSEMIVWGGINDDFGPVTVFNDGGRYNPSTNSWTATSTNNVPEARDLHTAVWTGSEMIVWGGIGIGSLNTGGKYNPVTNSWTATTTTNAPTGRHYHTVVWTGSEMIVWGGINAPSIFNTGGRYCVQSGPGTATVADFNGDSHPDFVVRNPGTRQTGIWYLNNNVFISGAFGPTLPVGWGLRGAADFNLDTHPDYGLFNSATRRTAIWYLLGPTFIGSAYGPTPPSGWTLVATADFNANGKPDYVLYNAGTRQTAIWHLNNNIFVSGAFGPTLPAGWGLRGVADFNGDTHPDYALFNVGTRQTAIWYLSGPTRIGGAFGPTVPSGWALVATKDFNGNGKPDYLLYNAGTRRTAIWYLNTNVYISGAYGPTLPAGWSLIAP
jgi:N-acetylneuraminic acid mutarotase